MNKTVRPVSVGSAYIAGAWVFLVAAMLAGIVGIYRMMSTGAGDAASCLCLGVLGVLLGIIAAVLALLGIHRVGVVALSVVPGFHGSHGSGDDDP